MKRNFIISLFLIVSGCFLSALEKPNVVQKGRAKLVFLHERAFWGEPVEIKINNTKVLVLSNNKYCELEVDANTIDIALNRLNSQNRNSKSNIQAKLTAETDRVYYLKIYREIDYFTNELYLVRISEQTAKKSIKTMKLEQNP